jgi:hypothetical protein
MFQKFVFLASFAGLLAGCALPSASAAPTPYPAEYLPTVIYLTAESINATKAAGITPTISPTDTPTPIPVTPSPTVAPTLGPGFQLSAIQINKPGPMSKIASPLELSVIAYPGKSNKVQFDLYGEDGRLLGRTIQFAPPHPLGDYLFVKIPFEIRAAAELGLIQVSTKDNLGNIQSLVSLRVLLISNGDSIINPAGNAVYERVALNDLPDGSVVSGGVLSLHGEFLPYNTQQVVFELISSDNKSLGLRVMNFPGLDMQNFSTTIPYKVDSPTQARLFIRQADDLLSSPAYVYSEMLTLNP